MEKFRIKIEQLKNGTIWYYPEVKISWWFRQLDHLDGWYNLDEDGNFTGSMAFDNIERALACIRKRRELNHIREGKEVVSVEYKYINE